MKTTASRASAVSQTRGFGDLLYDKAGSRPSLDLDFAGTSSLRDKITGEYLVDHTRASTGTYIDSEGLVKSATTNLIINSQLNTTTSWTKGANTTFTPNYAEAPDGTQTAHRIQHAATTSTFLGQTLSGLTSGKTYVFSFWWKRNGTDTTAQLVYGGSVHQKTIPTEWTRVFYTFTVGGGTSVIQFDNVGSTVNDYLIWHPQFEEGNNDSNTSSTPTNYVETVSSINSAPRFTHERVETGNLLAPSQTFWTGWDIGSQTTVTDYFAEAPDGTFTASRLVMGNTAGTYHRKTGITWDTSKTYTFSVYAKKHGASDKITLSTWGTSVVQSYTITDEWARYELTFTPTSSTTYIGFNETPSIGNDILIWGVQLEEGDSASTYVPSIDTFTSRATTGGGGTYIDSNGLVKTAHVNLITNSEDFTSYTRTGLNIINTDTGILNPVGTENVIRLKESGSGQHNLHTNVSGGLEGDTKYTVSVYFKEHPTTSCRYAGFTMHGHNFVVFDIQTGTHVLNSGNDLVENISITSAGNGWYRCSATFTTVSNPANDRVYLLLHEDGEEGGHSYGSNNNSMYAWGWQVTKGIEIGDYIKTTGTASGAARYSHDPETLTPTGLYLEPAATNYIHTSNLSQQVDDVHVNRTYNVGLAPDGTLTAARLSPNTQSNRHILEKNGWSGNIGTGTWSIFVKADTGRYISLAKTGNGHDVAIFDTLTGTITEQGSDYNFLYVIPYANGWYRLYINTNGAGYHRLSLAEFPTRAQHSAFSVDSPVFVGDPNQHSILYWGAQFEAGSYPSSVILTSGSQVTRAADVYTSTANLTETFEPRGLLIEEARTNIVPYSENFNVSNWAKNTINLAGQVTSPMGDNTAYNVVAIGNNNYHRLNLQFTATTNTYTASVFVKPNGYRYFHFRLEGGSVNNVGHGFDLQEGIGITGRYNGSSSLSSTSHRIEKYPNGWFKVSVTGNLTSGTGYMGLQISNSATSTASNATGNTTLGMHIWGAQLEIATFPTSYIPTSGSSATRSADIASISGDNFGTYRTNIAAGSEHLNFRLSSDPTWQYGGVNDPFPFITYNHPNPIDGKYNAALVDTSVIRTTNNNKARFKLSFSSAVGPANNYVFSAYVKPVSDECRVQLLTNQAANGFVNYNLRTNYVSNSALGEIQDIGTNGWKRIIFKPTNNTVWQAWNIYVRTGSDNQSRNSGTAENKFYIYAPQVEEASSVTNYIPPTDTFTSRLGNATYVDSNGLIKNSVVNLFPRSQPTSANQWDNVGGATGFTGNYAIAPDGTQTAGRLTMSNTGFTYFRRSVPVESGKTYTYSVYVKSNHATLNLTEAQIASVNLTESKELITLTDEWVRYTRTFTATITGNAIIGFDNGPRAIDHLVWGFQLEEGDTANEYVNTQSTNAASGAARYSHDPETLVPTGLYLEPATTNYWHHSNLFTASNFGAVNGMYNYSLNLTANAATAPDGTLTAASVIPQVKTGGNNYWMQQQHYQTTVNSTFSCFIKYNGWRYVAIRNGHGGSPESSALFDILNGTLVYTTGDTTANIEAYPNGWYRISCTRSDTNGGWASIVFRQNDDLAYGAPQYTTPNDGVSGAYLWGIQWEPNPYPTSVIISSGNDTTRAADVYTSTATTVLDRDGGNKEAFINVDKFSYFGHLSESPTTNGVSFHGGTFGAYSNPSNGNHTSFIDSYSQSVSYGNNSTYKAALAFSLNSTRSTVNGVLGTLSTNVNPINSTELIIGDRPSGSRVFNAPINRITFWKTRIPDSSLINITNT